MASLSLCCILKNELVNLPRLLGSVKGCFDEIHLTDTGSTDGSIELIRKYIAEGSNPSDSPLHLHHFEWVNDFAAARNYSFSKSTSDYLMWLDLDDVLSDAAAFIEWKTNAMELADYWLATYFYGETDGGTPNCSFARERVVKRNLELKWRYFIHEGLVPKSAVKNPACQYAVTWSVKHKRSLEDLGADRNRNLSIFEARKSELDARMRYYYGKELFEAKKHLDAFQELMTAIAHPELELHDRIMGIQYACLCAMHLNQFDRAITLAHQGIQLSPTRAEFYIVIGDSYIKQHKLNEAIPYFKAATGCRYEGNNIIQGPLFSHEDSYRHYPLNQLARIYVNTDRLTEAEGVIQDAIKLGAHPETVGLMKEFEKLKDNVGFSPLPKIKDEAIVISTHPNAPYEWDWDVYQNRGIGGSETAVVEMAEKLNKLTGREVLVFNARKEKKTFGGVSYIPMPELHPYLSRREPKVHIAWRHNVKLTNAPTYLWCHDLGVPGLDKKEIFEKVLCLSNFHKNYLKNIFGVPENKMRVTRNGIDPTRFANLDTTKDYGKVIWSSSPDRGLERAIAVMDEVVKEVPEARFHIFYGFDNMLLLNKHEEVSKFKRLINERPYIKNIGNIPQSQLTQEIASSCVWLYPTNFLETYCITAIEMLCGKVYPVVRKYGALDERLALSGANLLTIDCESKEEIAQYAREVIWAFKEAKWNKISVNPEDYSWENVAKEWVEILGV